MGARCPGRVRGGGGGAGESRQPPKHVWSVTANAIQYEQGAAAGREARHRGLAQLSLREKGKEAIMKRRGQHITGLPGITRRDALRLGATAAAGVAVGPFVLRVAGAGEAFNWQRFKGSKIFIQFTKNPWADTMQKMLPDFEKQTGIKVEFADLARDPGPPEADGGVHRRLRRHRRLVYQPARGEAPVLEVRLVPRRQQVPEGPDDDRAGLRLETTWPPAPRRS